jgi:hypothetical protein
MSKPDGLKAIFYYTQGNPVIEGGIPVSILIMRTMCNNFHMNDSSEIREPSSKIRFRPGEFLYSDGLVKTILTEKNKWGVGLFTFPDIGAGGEAGESDHYVGRLKRLAEKFYLPFDKSKIQEVSSLD